MGIPVTKKVQDVTKFWNLLLYADSGAGKTIYALRKGPKRLLVLAIGAEEDGLMSAAKFGTDADMIEAKTWQDVIGAVRDLGSPEGQQWLRDNYDVLAVDSLTEADSAIMKYILAQTKDVKLAKDTDPEVPWIDDYGTRNRLLEKFVRALNDLPINTFYTALARAGMDADKRQFVVPMIGGNKETDFRFSMKIASLMTGFGYMRVEENLRPAPTEEAPDAKVRVRERITYWDDTSFSKGKDRTFALTSPTGVVNNNIQKMCLMIEGKIDQQGNKLQPKTAARTATKAAPKKVTPPAAKSPESTPKPVVSEPAPTPVAAPDTAPVNEPTTEKPSEAPKLAAVPDEPASKSTETPQEAHEESIDLVPEP